MYSTLTWKVVVCSLSCEQVQWDHLITNLFHEKCDTVDEFIECTNCIEYVSLFWRYKLAIFNIREKCRGKERTIIFLEGRVGIKNIEKMFAKRENFKLFAG